MARHQLKGILVGFLLDLYSLTGALSLLAIVLFRGMLTKSRKLLFTCEIEVSFYVRVGKFLKVLHNK